MKHFNFWALALTAICMAACTSEDDLTIQSPPVENGTTEVPIMFSSSSNNFTRADLTGAVAAEKLGNKFVVTGFKGSSTATVGSMVFDNYVVEYAANTAHTTESNSKNWEYVGKALIPHAVTNGITQQAIKYWDFTKTQYDFFAWSTGSGVTAVYDAADEADGYVYVSNIIPNSKNANWATGDDPIRPAYSLTGSAEDLSKCYISDLVTVNKSSDTPGYGEIPGYNDAAGNAQIVTLKFRQLGTKVRIALYETVPGYSVKNVKFYTKGGTLEATSAGDDETPGTVKDGQIVDNATIFAANADIYTHGTYTVYFPTVDTPNDIDNNQAHIKYSGTGSDSKTTIVDWGTLNYTYRESGEKDDEAVYLGRASNEATYAGDPANDYYKFYLPNESGTNLNLRVDFTLESIDGSGEIIEVKNARAQVPSIYTTWKPGYAYTYLFKISDNTNGRTGVYDPTQADDATINSDPAGLYPITFDAVAVNAEDGDHTQETITTIATPSITTYQKGSKVIDNNEYLAATGDIFVTVNEGDDVVALQSGDPATLKAALYTIPEIKTEADVVDALTYQDDDQTAGSIKGRSGLVLTEVAKVASDATLAANQWKLTDKVEYGVDGNVINVATDKVLRFHPNAGYYAFVYTKTATKGTATPYFEARAFSDFATGETKYRYDYKPTVATGDNGTPSDDSDDKFDALKGHVYFKKSGDAEPYTYTRVANPFIGQDVSNLYLNNTGTSKASGYAVSGTTYYYTTNGQTYPEAHPVVYNETNSLTGLYVEDTTPGTYRGVTDADGSQPVNGKAYYYRTGTGTGDDPYVFTYCVFLPLQVKGMFELDTTADKVQALEDTAVDGQTYFEKYTQNNGEYYVKVIKVQ